jgi:ABC-2 type transport system permease protein
MSSSPTEKHLWSLQLHAALVVAKKNVLIYYLKAPVLIFGVLFPVFFFLAFATGRPVSVEEIAPGMLAMALFFTASAVGPLVTPWERQAKTYERLISSPASLEAILAGDVLAGLGFGAVFSAIPLALALALTKTTVAAPVELLVGLGLGALTFASLGVLLSAPATQSPSQIMMLANLVRLPLIFVSGVFVPIEKMPAWGRCLAASSPLSYCTDLVRRGFGYDGYFPLWLAPVALLGFTAIFLLVARRLHHLGRRKGQ